MNQPRATVLVIDDEPDMREMLAFDLSQEGFDVHTAENGLGALEALKWHKFDLAITDLKMPGMDGVQTVSCLKQLDPHLEVIVATGYATVETAIACMKGGAYDYIHKPYDLNELRLLLQRALEKSRLAGAVTLYEASRALIGTLDRVALIQAVLDVGGKIMPSTAVGLVLRGDDGNEYFRNVSMHTLPDTFLSSVAEDSREQRAPRRTTLMPRETALTPAERLEGETSALVFPLFTRDNMLGGLVLTRSPKLPAFTDSEWQRAQVFAAQVSLALENAHLYGEVESKMHELVRTRDQLVQVEKLALAGQLAGAVAHEVNNPLAFLRANFDSMRDYIQALDHLWNIAQKASEYLAKRKDQKGQELARALVCTESMKPMAAVLRDVREIMQDNREGVDRIAELIAGFSRLSGLSTSVVSEEVDLFELVEECVAQGVTPATIARECDGPLCVRIGREDLRTSLLHVFKYLHDRREKLEAPPLEVRLGCTDDGAFVRIEDAVVSLSEEEHARIFDPRVDARGGKTMRLDIGLTMAYQLLRRNHAELRVTRGSPRGLSFSLMLGRIAE